MRETIVLGGGCFWCLEAVFQQVRGVEKVISGYMGGSTESPQYAQVCQGDTGHAEVVWLEFDSSEITCAQILDIFFAMHDPSTLNRQGNDVGTQYRSVIFTCEASQYDVVVRKISDLGLYHSSPIVTELVPASHFWPAEIEHHDYYRRHTAQPYCRAVVEPKLRKFLTQFANIAK